MLEMNVLKDEEETGFSVWRAALGTVMFIGIVWLVLRMSPWCFVKTGSFGWHTWTYAFPNLVCALDLRAAGNKAFEEELNRRMKYFENLRQLDISKNNLTQVPSSVIGLSKLQSLSLNDNHLTSIPTEIYALSELRSLDVSNNNLRSLPDSLGNMSLESLNASDNEISKLPVGLALSPSLQNIDITLNPIPPDVEEHIAENVTQNVTHGSTGSTSPNPSSQPGQTSSASSAHSSLASQSANGSSDTSLSSNLSASSDTSASISLSSASSSEDPIFYCDRNLTVNDYRICIPPDWTVTNLGKYSADLYLNDTLMARVHCPLEQNNYNNWDFSIRSRTFLKDGIKYGTDLWYGTPLSGTTGAFMILFMHKNDFNSWYGPNYTDVLASCQIESTQPENEQNIFRTMYLSIE